MTEVVSEKKSNKTKWIIALVAFSALIALVAFLYVKYTLFTIKAEGIALGYARAASSAYQVGRPLPDVIFEEGNYRIEVKNLPQSNGNLPVISINVRDKYTNITHHSYEHQVSSTAPVMK